jgi:putative nucleotidyltransferase with HDIG domain
LYIFQRNYGKIYKVIKQVKVDLHSLFYRLSENELLNHISDMDLSETIENVSILHAELEAQNDQLQESLLNLNSLNKDLEIYFNDAPFAYIILKDLRFIIHANKKALDTFRLTHLANNYGILLTYIEQFPDKKSYMDWIESDEPEVDLTLKTREGSRRFKLRKSNLEEELDGSKKTLIALVDIHAEFEHRMELNRKHEEMLYSFIAISEQKDAYTAGHSKRVAYYATRIAEALHLPHNEVDAIYKIGMLHDIGKIIVPESVLLKPERLNEIEMSLMKDHVTAGFDILNPISFYEEMSYIVRAHHERYDGSGYPDGLEGDKIPLHSQIIGIADTFDAMTTNRIYKARKSVHEAADEIASLAGTWFEPSLAKTAQAFFRTLPEIEHVNQIPTTEIEKHRFSYFFKDALTNVYNGEYLNLHLSENAVAQNYNCFNFFQIRNMQHYNRQNGWSKGDELLVQFAKKLKEYIGHEMIFRVYGDDFITLNKEHFDVDLNIINAWSFIQESPIEITHEHFNLNETQIENWKDMDSLIQGW